MRSHECGDRGDDDGPHAHRIDLGQLLDPLGCERCGPGSLVPDPGTELDVPLLQVLAAALTHSDRLDVFAGRARKCFSRS
ncbi:hypothetical protein GCM10009647_053750 [Streptomyces sanglieri]